MNKLKAHSIICASFVLFISAALAQPEASEVEVQLEAERSVLAHDPAEHLPLNIAYASVFSPMPVYNSLDAVRAGRIAEYHGGQNTWVAVYDSAQVGGETYYQVRWDWERSGWMAANAITFNAQLSRLRGVDLSGWNGEHLAMVYVSTLNVRSEPGVIEDETNVGQLQHYDLVTVLEERAVEGSTWYRIGEGQWIHSGYVRNLVPGLRPEGVGEDERWIEVNINEQILVAHEGDRPVFATLTATGRPGAETVTGLYRIWTKFTHAPMAIPTASPPYDLAEVPYIMYFEGSYGIHGGYWHDNYGTVQSNGCVNLSPHDAEWLFNWASPERDGDERETRPTEDEPGTWVYVWQ